MRNQTAVDRLWAKYGTQILSENVKEEPIEPKKTSVPQKLKVQTVKTGKSTINIRDDGSIIHYESDTAIDLFDFLDFLSGRYGPSNEMADSVKIDGKQQNQINNVERTTKSDDAMEEFYRDKLSEVNWQIVDIIAKDEPLTDKDMDKLTVLYEEQDYLHKQLKMDLYDEDLSVADRLMLAGQGEAYSRVYGPGTIIELSNQALDELFYNKNSDVLKQLLDTQKYIERRISGLRYLERNGFITALEKEELAKLQSEKERIENDIKKYKYSFDTSSHSVQGSLKGLQYKQKATEGLSPVQK